MTPYRVSSVAPGPRREDVCAGYPDHGLGNHAAGLEEDPGLRPDREK